MRCWVYIGDLKLYEINVLQLFLECIGKYLILMENSVYQFNTQPVLTAEIYSSDYLSMEVVNFVFG